MFKQKNKQRFFSGIILFFLIFSLFNTTLFYPRQAKAILGAGDIVTDVGNIGANISNGIKNVASWALNRADKLTTVFKEHAAATAFKYALSNFLRQLAIDTATWISTGGQGNNSLLYKKGWGPYLKNAVDSAAGDVLVSVAIDWGSQIDNDDNTANFNECISDCSKIDDNKKYSRCQKKCSNNFEEAQNKVKNDGVKLNRAGGYGSGTGASITKFLCEPDLNLKLRIMGGISAITAPKAPKCTFSKMSKNWDKFVNQPDFLVNFQDYWEPSNNDVGISLSLFSEYLKKTREAKFITSQERLNSEGVKPVKNLVGNILTPSAFVKELGFKPIKEGTKMEEINTGDIIADAINVFGSTLMGQIINKWIKKGMNYFNKDNNSNNEFNWLSNDANKNNNHIKLAREKFNKIFKPTLTKGKAYSILKKLMLCPNPKNPGSTDCVIDSGFVQAIEKQLTVEEAIDGGYLKTDVPFGFINSDLEPEYNQGYPYRSLIILRKYRIIPVGWELAASYIGKYGNKTYNIQEIVNNYNNSKSPFYKLIDPSWVLKAPEMYCSAEGYSENLDSEEVSEGVDINKDGDYNDQTDGDILPKVNINRNKYCADEKSCIKEDSHGSCLFYGYCNEEKRLFNFQGDKCEPQFSNCQKFTDYQGHDVFYTKNSLDYNNCNSSSVGCAWYCVSKNPKDNAWMCAKPGKDLVPVAVDTVVYDINDIDQDGDNGITAPSGSPQDFCTILAGSVQCFLEDSQTIITTENINSPNLNSLNDLYLNNSANECRKVDEGCHEYIRTKPNLSTNLLLNSNFEGFDVDGDGDSTNPSTDLTYFWIVDAGEIDSFNSYSGTHSFKSDVNQIKILQTVDTGYSLASRKFILSFFGDGDCVNGSFRFYASNAGTIYNYNGTDITSPDGQTTDEKTWQKFSVAYTFPYFIPTYIKDITVEIGTVANPLPANCRIDAVQLEETRGIDNQPNAYNEYQQNNLLYLKKAPNYYNCDKYTIIKDYSDKANCEDNGFYWRDKNNICVEGGSPECENFAFECNQDDIGCDLYTPQNGDPGIPGVVASGDFCPKVCDGYDIYKQSATFFDLEKFPEYLITNNEKKCPASAEGCSEFTNLDKVEKGGESLKSYTYLRPCQAIDGSCANFYTWVGSETTGYQLKAYLLKDANFDGKPDMLISDANISYITNEVDCVKAGHNWNGSQCEGGPIDILGECDDPSWDMPTNGQNDIISNPNCFEFYSEDKTISYVHYKNTKTCSDECTPYRKTVSTPTDCGVGNNWGTWKTFDIDNADGDNNNTTGVDVEYCLYEALSDESVSCSANNNGCYEYKGNTSNDVRNIINDNFESGINDWVTDGATISLSSESLSRGGHSLKISSANSDYRVMYPLKMECDNYIDTTDPDPDPLYCNVDEGCECQVDTKTVCFVGKGENTCLYKSSILPGRSYSVSFWAKGSGDLTVRFSSATVGDEFANGDISVTNKWIKYSLGPVFIHDGWDMNADIPDPVYSVNNDYKEVLAISGFNGTSYIDNFVLKEIRDNLFLIKPATGIWNIPKVCDQDNDKNFAPQYMLGCQKYHSQTENNNVYLKSFNHLCSEDVVGCESLIDTSNSDNPLEQKWNEGALSEVVVDKDHFIPLVNNKDKQCNVENKGCTALGLASYSYNQHQTYNDGLTIDYGRNDDTDDLYEYTTKYLINDPNKYTDSLCDYTNIGCNKFTTENGGEFYFKDPFSQRISQSPLVCEYKKGELSEQEGWYIKGTTQYSPNCPIDITGTGIKYPNRSSANGRLINWTGQCSAALDSCSEYIDPISLISKNIVFNNDFSQDVDNNGIPDGWQLSGNFYSLEEPISLKENTVYTIIAQKSDGGSYEIKLNRTSCYLTSPDNSVDIDNLNYTFTLPFNGSGQFSGRVYSAGFNTCGLSVSKDFVTGGGVVKIVETGLYYYLDNSIDKSGCNGYINYNDGCVIFNDRNITDGIDGNLEELIYDADLVDKKIPTFGVSSTENDSNILVKTQPDRECGEWDYCKSIVKTKDSGENDRQMCLEIGLCNSINSEGICNGFPINKTVDEIFNNSNSDVFRDKSGYSKVGINFGDLNGDGLDEKVDGYYPLERMTQVGGKILVPNGDFEITNFNGDPTGWTYNNSNGNNQNNYFSTIRDPISSQKEGLDIYAPSGRNYLKIDADTEAVSEKIDVNFFVTADNETNINYFIDGYLNTRNLFNGKAVIQILSYDNSDNILSTQSALSLDYGQDWVNLNNKIILPVNTSLIELKIKSVDGAEGHFYVDNINIRPALAVSSGINKYVNQSCRAYPKSDSLACDYHDEKGIKNIGWEGYCLEYDRAPGNPHQCLLWWPVDLLLGEGSNEAETGYSGKYPVYYCSKTRRVVGYKGDWAAWLQNPVCSSTCCGSELTVLNNRLVAKMSSDEPGGWSGGGCSDTPSNNIPPSWSGTNGFPCGNCAAGTQSIPIPTPLYTTPDGYKWYLYSDMVPFFNMAGTGYKIEHDASLTFDIVIPTGNLIGYNDDDHRYVCDQIVQTVTPTGQNKYWSDRVFAGTNYITAGNFHYNYKSFDAPFGSLVNLTPDNDPTQWIFDELNNYPVMTINNSAITNDSLPDSYGQNWENMVGTNSYLSRLFAQSYGSWVFDLNTKRYKKSVIPGSAWEPPNYLCSGDPPTRPKYDSSSLSCNGGDCFQSCSGPAVNGNTCDWCGVPPRIENIKLNNQPTGNYYISNSGTVNLNFNSIVDINQSPLVMYVIDWGDGTDTDPNYILGSGISINDKPNKDNPHSFFHLYGYWDMLGKDNLSTSIDCADSGGNLFGDKAKCLDTSPCCATQIKTKIKDNWGWCNNGTKRNDCDTFIFYDGYVIVSQYENSCTPTCSTTIGCRSSAPANSIISDSSSSACCGTGSCYSCDTDSGFIWDETVGKCVSSYTDTCFTSVGCRVSVPAPLNAVVDSSGICYTPGESCFECQPGYIWDGGNCFSNADNCTDQQIQVAGTSYDAIGCLPSGSQPPGYDSFVPGGAYCPLSGTDLCYYCPAGQIWNGAICIDPNDSTACGGLNGDGNCPASCLTCLNNGNTYSCNSPNSPTANFTINDTNNDSKLTSGESLNVDICIPRQLVNTSFNLQYDGSYFNGNDCDDSNITSFPASDCKIPPDLSCSSGWHPVYDSSSVCNIDSANSPWININIPAGKTYATITDNYNQCCNLCDNYSKKFQFTDSVLGLTTNQYTINYNNDDCSCSTWKDSIDFTSGCNDIVHTTNGSDYGLSPNTCDLSCSADWILGIDPSSSCCGDGITPCTLNDNTMWTPNCY